jgi:hypothetical protein
MTRAAGPETLASMDERSRHRRFEDSFLGQIRARALALTRGALPADQVVFESTPDGIDELRATLARLELYDRNALEQLPGTRAMQMRFVRSRLGGLLRETIARVRVRVLAPVESLIRGEAGGPVTREQVLDALARYEVLPRRERPSAVVLASATGFTPEARALVETPGSASLILLGGRDDGGWDIDLPPAVRRSAWSRLFELESRDDRLRRVMYHLEQDSAALDSRGVSLPELAEKLGLPLGQTELLVRQACRTQPRLMTVVHEGVVHVCRTPLAEEGTSMSTWSRIRRWLRLKPTTAERVRELTVQRVRLEQQRHEVDQKIEKLETEERTLLKSGSQAASDAERKQLAGKLVRVRRDLSRQRAQAQMYTNQIDVIGTHIHHLTLTAQGQRVSLPKAEDLTQEAAQAEQLMAELATNADLAASIEVGAQSPAMQAEEAAIMEEFRQVAAGAQAPAGPVAERPTPQAASPASAAPAAREAALPPTPGSASKGRAPAGPELG